MKAIDIFLAVSIFGLAHRVSAQTADGKEVVVFVHGLAGFGEDELAGIAYWQYKGEFPSSHFRTFVASVGPVSSNWDRACELYAQIKGTRVDYGASHSATHGHNRYGKDYTGQGFFPEWDANNRIHLIGHSMGGMTIRLLEILLQEGDSVEQAAGGDVSPLFTGQGNWIKSITTFSTPHDGTPLVEQLDSAGLLDLIEDLVLGFAGIGSFIGLDGLYDFDLDHWGLTQQSGESFTSYWNRIRSSSVWNDGNTDLAPFDLSPEGAEVLNNRGQQTYPNTYYFGYATEQTYSWWSVGFFDPQWIEKAESDMWIILAPFANIIGGRSNTIQSWRKNDGLVPLESSKCPRAGNGYGGCTEYTGNWQPNQWYWQVQHFDHLQIIGFTFGYYFVVDNIYEAHANRIASIFSQYGAFSIAAPVTGLTAGAASTSTIIVGAVGAAMFIGAVLLLVASHRRARATERLADAMQDYISTPDSRVGSMTLRDHVARRSSSATPSAFSSQSLRSSSIASLFPGSSRYSTPNPRYAKESQPNIDVPPLDL